MQDKVDTVVPVVNPPSSPLLKLDVPTDLPVVLEFLSDKEIEERKESLSRRFPPRTLMVLHEKGEKVPPVFTEMTHFIHRTMDNAKAKTALFEDGDPVLLEGATRNERVERMMLLVEKMPSTWGFKTRSRWFHKQKYGYVVWAEPRTRTGWEVVIWLDGCPLTWEYRNLDSAWRRAYGWMWRKIRWGIPAMLDRLFAPRMKEYPFDKIG